MEVYLDNSATTMCYPEVGELVYHIMCRDYGNPSAMYRKGMEAERYIKEAKETISKLLKVNAKEIIFTSGGTESDNQALIGCARANRRNGNHLITSCVEHPAILNTMHYLEEEEGFRVTYLPVDECGRIRLDALKEALCPETILVSVMYVNNEIGTVQPVAEAARIVKQYKHRNYSKMKTIVSTSLISFCILSILLGAFGFGFSRLMMSLLQTPADILDEAVLYLRVYFVGFPFLFMYNILSTMFTSIGESKIPLGLLIFSSILNIFMDLWMVAGLGLGVFGVFVLFHKLI